MTEPLNAVTTVLCDADGNLFPSEEPAFVASVIVTNAFLASLGIEERFTAEQLRISTTGKNFRSTAADLASSFGVTLEDAALHHWVEEERRDVSAYLGTVLTPDPEVIEPLRMLGKRFELAVVTSSATSRVQTCLDASGLADLLSFDRLYSAEDSLPTPTSKPHPAVYQYACSQLGICAEAAVAVEDSVPGTQSAVAAGVRTIGNLQFVQPAERETRREQLLAAGAFVVVECWAQAESLLP